MERREREGGGHAQKIGLKRSCNCPTSFPTATAFPPPPRPAVLLARPLLPARLALARKASFLNLLRATLHFYSPASRRLPSFPPSRSYLVTG